MWGSRPGGYAVKRIAVVALGLGVMALAAWRLWPGAPVDDETLIRAAIDDMAAKAAKKDIAGILEHVGERYQGEGGSKRELKAYLLGYLMRSGLVAAIPANVRIELPSGDSAKVSLVVLLARTPAKSAEGVAPEQLIGSHRIEAKLAREAGSWSVVAATRRDAMPGDLLP